MKRPSMFVAEGEAEAVVVCPSLSVEHEASCSATRGFTTWEADHGGISRGPEVHLPNPNPNPHMGNFLCSCAQ
jgi:hypothetical protein